MSQAAIVTKISIVFIFPHVQAYVSKTDLAVKLVNVVLGPSLEQNYDGLKSQIYKPSLVKFGPPVLEMIFEHL